MFIKPPITNLLIRVSKSGFYRGFSKDVTITAIDLELSGVAEGAIAGAGQADQLFVMLGVILSENLAYLMSIVILLLTYLVTTADSAVLIINTINAAGDEDPKARPIFYSGESHSHCL